MGLFLNQIRNGFSAQGEVGIFNYVVLGNCASLGADSFCHTIQFWHLPSSHSPLIGLPFDNHSACNSPAEGMFKLGPFQVQNEVYLVQLYVVVVMMK